MIFFGISGPTDSVSELAATENPAVAYFNVKSTRGIRKIPIREPFVCQLSRFAFSECFLVVNIIIKACRSRPPVSPESNADVPHRLGLLRSSVRCNCRSLAAAIRQSPSTDCSTCPLQHFRLSLLRFCWSYSLEFIMPNNLHNPAVGPDQF